MPVKVVTIIRQKKDIFWTSQQKQKFDHQVVSNLFTLHAFYLHLQQLKEEEVLLAFVEEQRNVSQMGVHCVLQEVLHSESVELCM